MTATANINIICHSERSEESRGVFARGKRIAALDGFFAPLRMTDR
jgi:hypothetical protein